METIKYSNARQTLRTVIDDCVNNSQPVIIESKANEVVIISKAQYDIMQDFMRGNTPISQGGGDGGFDGYSNGFISGCGGVGCNGE